MPGYLADDEGELKADADAEALGTPQSTWCS